MRLSILFGLVLTTGVWAQAPAPDASEVPPQTVVATVNGTKLTAGQLQSFVSALPPQLQQFYAKDRKEFLRQYGLLELLSGLAEKAKVAEQSPTKERLQYARMQVLMQGMIDDATAKILVGAEEQQKFYATNKERYSQAKIKVLYVSFSAAAPPASADPKAKRPLSEAEAQAKAADLRKQILAGADFVKLVKEHSEDATSAAKDGDFGAIKRSDNVPDTIKTVVFALKPGEVSEPVRQPNGFYLFRLEGLVAQTYDEVRDAIYMEMRQAKFNEWFEGTRKQVDVKFDHEPFFATTAAPPSAVTPQPGPPPTPAKPKP